MSPIVDPALTDPETVLGALDFADRVESLGASLGAGAGAKAGAYPNVPSAMAVTGVSRVADTSTDNYNVTNVNGTQTEKLGCTVSSVYCQSLCIFLMPPSAGGFITYPPTMAR